MQQRDHGAWRPNIDAGRDIGGGRLERLSDGRVFTRWQVLVDCDAHEQRVRRLLDVR